MLRIIENIVFQDFFRIKVCVGIVCLYIIPSKVPLVEKK